MKDDEIRQRMIKLMEPIQVQLMVCTEQDELMLASLMLSMSKSILVKQLGVEGAKTILKESTNTIK